MHPRARHIFHGHRRREAIERFVQIHDQQVFAVASPGVRRGDASHVGLEKDIALFRLRCSA